jgi:AraC-like DNA-binding protein
VPSELQFQKWLPNLNITRDGKHIYNFKQDFPLAIFSYRFPYYIRLVPNYHDYFEITYNCGGPGILNVSNREYAMGTDAIAVIGPNEMHSIHSTGKTHLDMLSVFFMPGLISAPGSDDSLLDLTRPFFHGTRHVIEAQDIDHEVVFGCIHEMHRLENTRPKFYRLLLRHQLFELLLKILQHYDAHDLIGTGSRSSPRLRRAKVHHLNKVFGLVEARYRDQISLDQAAQLCNMSRTYFCRFFKNVTGTTFIDYLNNFRISRAKEMMLLGDLTATQIAYQVGFNNLGYFFRSFKKYANLRPKEFVSEHSK